MKEQFLKDVKGQPNLPRWFSSIFKMIQSPNAGSLIIQLPDNRKFIVESKKPGANAYIVVKNEHFLTIKIIFAYLLLQFCFSLTIIILSILFKYLLLKKFNALLTFKFSFLNLLFLKLF